MKIPLSRIVVCVALITLMVTYSTIAYASAVSSIAESAPYTIKVTPKTATVKPGDTVSYRVEVNASSGFNDQIVFTITISAPAYSTTLDIGSVSPPYPKVYDVPIKIPSDMPVSLTATGVLKGTSGSYTQTENVEITIQSQSPGGDIIGMILKALTDFWNWLTGLFGHR